MLAYREQAISAKGTAVVLATITKGIQQHKECESLRAWRREGSVWRRAEERVLSPDGKHHLRSTAKQGNIRIPTSGFTARFLGPKQSCYIRIPGSRI